MNAAVETGSIPAEPDWRPLPRAARTVFLIGDGLGIGVPALVAAFPLWIVFGQRPWMLAVALALLAAAVSLGLWNGARRWRSTLWALGADGLRIRRGLWWRSETLVPRSRVQHLDLERGPLERRFGLASLVIHTAGTRLSAVRLPCLEEPQATALRDRLVRDSSDDDDAV